MKRTGHQKQKWNKTWRRNIQAKNKCNGTVRSRTIRALIGRTLEERKSMDEIFRNLIAPNQSHSRRCPSCRKCRTCCPPTLQSSKDRQSYHKRQENRTLRECIRITLDLKEGETRDLKDIPEKERTYRITVKLPIDEKKIAERWIGDNRQQVSQEWNRKIKKLDDGIKNSYRMNLTKW